MRCIICDSTDRWENVDQFRHTEKGMHICMNCGFTSYPSLYKSEDEIKKHYATNYRPAPNISNAYTGQKKLNIHAAFLKETFDAWKKAGVKEPVVCDIGAAYGVFLNWVRGIFPHADVSGTEYALSYRRNAWWEYGIKLDLDFDKSKKYHMIASYKVAEHQLDADKRIREYVECLHDDGLIYISVPIWFERMSNFGGEGFDLEYYYDPNHINVWTQKHFRTLLKKCGLEIIKEDHWMYDSTFLCRRNDALMKEKPEFEHPTDIKQIMKAIKQAAVALESHQWENAIKAFQNFPIAWVNYFEANRQKAHAKGQGSPPIDYVKKHFIEPALKACPYSLDILRLVMDIYMRYEDYNTAAAWAQKALELRPNHPIFLMCLTQCLRQIAARTADPNEKAKIITEARECSRHLRDIDMQMRPEATNWIYKDNADLPMPHE